MALKKNKVKRSPKNLGNVDQGAVQGMEFNAYAGAKKILPVGPEFSWKNTATPPAVSGQDASSGLGIEMGTPIALYNNSDTVAWATMAKGTTAPAAPSGITTGIPLKANDWTYLNMGENDKLRTSANTVGVYIIADDGTYQVVQAE